MQKFGLFIARHRVAILIIGALLLFPAAIGFVKTQVNYDLLSYLPSDIDSVQAENVLDCDFNDASTGMLVIRGMPDKDVAALKEQIARSAASSASCGRTISPTSRFPIPSCPRV